MQNITTLVIAGIIFGTSNGLSPGPTLTLVISQTLQHNLKAGLKVAASPLLFGLIIIPISVFISIKLTAFKNVLGLVSIIGSIYIAYLGFNNIFSKK
jgi:threonine/homoserine/homoserine lactone efflux protein